EGQPVVAGDSGVTRAEVLAVGQPDPALAVDADARGGVARGPLVVLDHVRRGLGARVADARGRQFRGRSLEGAVGVQADDADGAVAEERVAGAGQGAGVLAPLLGAFLVGDPQAALGVVGDRRAGL